MDIFRSLIRKNGKLPRNVVIRRRISRKTLGSCVLGIILLYNGNHDYGRLWRYRAYYLGRNGFVYCDNAFSVRGIRLRPKSNRYNI